MSETEIVRSWKDISHRRSLNATRPAEIPANPAGTIEAPDSASHLLFTPICTRLFSGPCLNC
jgi:mersacidin/lichenicidin family type 2 lantibiotic